MRFSCSCLHVSGCVAFHINFSWVLPLDVHLTQERWTVAGGQILVHHVRFISEKSLILQNQKMVGLKGRVKGHLLYPPTSVQLMEWPKCNTHVKYTYSAESGCMPFPAPSLSCKFCSMTFVSLIILITAVVMSSHKTWSGFVIEMADATVIWFLSKDTFGLCLILSALVFLTS